MLFKIISLIWREYKLQAIVSTALMFSVGFLNGLSIVAIVPLINTTGGASGKGGTFIQGLFNRLFAVVGSDASFINILFLLLLLFIIKGLFSIIQSVLSRWIQINIEIDKKTSLYNLLLNTDLTYLNQCNFGRITNIIITQTSLIAYLVELFSRFFTGLINLSIYLVIVFLVSWQLTLITAVISGVMYYLIKKFFIRVKTLGYEIVTFSSVIQELTNYTLSGYKAVKSYVLEQLLIDRMRDLLQQWERASIRIVTTESLLKSIFEPAVLIIAIFVYLFYHFELAAFLTFLVALYRMYISFQDIQNTHYKMAANVASLEIYEETLAGFASHQYPEHKGYQFESLRENITFQKVSYAYKISQSPFVLGPLDLEIPKGKMIGLVGRSGSGKSTCVDLLVGLLQPDAGVITVDGITLSHYSMTSFRKRVSYVSQDLFLLNDTLFRNIAFGDQNITRAQVQEACRLAQAQEFIEALPLGYDTVLGEHGASLSGGQKQRIALARALTRKPDILILDEATSALDNESEKQVQAAIESLSGDITIIVIAHRLSTVRNADYLYLFENGRIIEEGSFDALLDRRGKFFDLHTMAQ